MQNCFFLCNEQDETFSGFEQWFCESQSNMIETSREETAITFYPWSYPVHIPLSSSGQMQRMVDVMLSEYQNLAVIYKMVNNNSLLKTLIAFKRHLEMFNAATKAMLGHRLHSLKRICKMIQTINKQLYAEKDSLTKWRDAEELCAAFLCQKHLTFPTWEKTQLPQLPHLMKQTLESLAKMTTQEFPPETVLILAKKLYLTEKVRYNLKKKTVKQNQKEQVSIVPWSVKQPHWAQAAKWLRKSSSKIRTLMKKTTEQKSFTDEKTISLPSVGDRKRKRSKKTTSCRLSNKRRRVQQNTEQRVSFIRDKSNGLWEASKMKDISWNPNGEQMIFKQ